MKHVMMREVLRSGRHEERSVPMVLRLTDADRRPSQVTQSPCLLHGDDEKFAKIANSDVAEKRPFRLI